MKHFKTVLLSGLMGLSLNVMAHTSIMRSTPEQGAVMDAPLQSLQLEFGNPVRLVQLKLIDESGRSVELEFQPVLKPDTHFSQPVPALPAGRYQLHWGVMGQDGHMMKGAVKFIQQ